MSLKGINDNNYEFYDFYKMFEETEGSQETKTEEIEVKKEESSQDLTLYGVAIAEEIDILIGEYLPIKDFMHYVQRSKKTYGFYLNEFRIKMTKENDKIYTLFTFSTEKIISKKKVRIEENNEFVNVFNEYKNTNFKEIKIDRGACSSYKQVKEQSDQEIFKFLKKLNGNVADRIFHFIREFENGPAVIGDLKPKDLYMVEELVVGAVNYYKRQLKGSGNTEKKLEDNIDEKIERSISNVLTVLPSLASMWIWKENLEEAARIVESDLYLNELKSKSSDSSIYIDQFKKIVTAYENKYKDTKDEEYLKKFIQLKEKLSNYSNPNGLELYPNPLSLFGSNLSSKNGIVKNRSFTIQDLNPNNIEILEEELEPIIEEIKEEESKPTDGGSAKKSAPRNFLQKITDFGKKVINSISKKKEEPKIQIEKEESSTDTDTSHDPMNDVD
jgi:hypothetical protein